MKFNSRAFVVLSIAVGTTFLAPFLRSAEVEEKLISWPAGCVVVLAEKSIFAKNEKEDLTELSKALSKVLRTYGGDSAMWAKSNPDGCFWVELWRPGGDSFILQIESNGARLLAGNIESARKALDFLKSKSTNDGASAKIPSGWYMYDGNKINKIK